MPFKVIHQYIYGWDDAEWMEDDKPMRFDTREAAWAEIDEAVSSWNEDREREGRVGLLAQSDYDVEEVP
tara:strand:- start:792 stop:998 length:207 start_codon:yes stop_codon:yes gene_type:complete